MRAPGLHDIHWYVHKLFKFFIDIHVQFPKCPNPWSFPCIESTERSWWWIFSTSGGFKSSRIQLKINNELMTFNQISVIFLSKIYWVKFPELITFSFYHIFWSSISSMIWIRGVLWIFQAFSSAQRRPPAGPTKSLTYRWSRCSPPSTPSGSRDSAALPQSSPLVWDMDKSDKLSEYIYIWFHGYIYKYIKVFAWIAVYLHSFVKGARSPMAILSG